MRSNRGWSSPAKKVKRTYGYTAKILVKNSRHFPKKTIVLKKSETILNTKNRIKLSKSQSSSTKVKSKLLKTAENKLKKLGKSLDGLRLVKLRYDYKLNGKKRYAYFSSTAAKIRNKKDLERVLESLVKSFESKLQKYNASGFSDISISGIRIHAYENE